MVPSVEQETGASRVGADLRTARRRLGWELPDIAAALRIRLAHLEALEEGRVADLPGMTYAIGFLRTYAASLGLDPDEMVRRLKADAGQVNRPTELSFPAPVPERGVPAGAVVLLGVVLAIGAYVGWYRLSGQGKLPAEVVPPVPARLAPLADQALPPPPPKVSAPPPAAPSSVPAPAPVPGPAPVPQIASVQPSVPPSSAAAAIPTPPAPEASSGPGAEGQTPATPDDDRIVLRAKSDAWVQVRDKTGQVLLSRVLRAGESWPVPPKPTLLLTTGNAGGTELVVDGVVARPIGTPGAVRRDVPLDPDLIKEGKLPAQAASATPGSASRNPPQ